MTNPGCQCLTRCSRWRTAFPGAMNGDDDGLGSYRARLAAWLINSAAVLDEARPLPSAARRHQHRSSQVDRENCRDR